MTNGMKYPKHRVYYLNDTTTFRRFLPHPGPPLPFRSEATGSVFLIYFMLKRLQEISYALLHRRFLVNTSVIGT